MPSLAEYAALYEELSSEFSKQKWFKKGWQTQAGFYPNAAQPKSAYLQLFRDSWFNEEGKGIHFESWMTSADVVRGTTSIVLHIESSKERTGINGKTLVKALLADVGERIASWEGYAIKETYTMQPFIKKRAITPNDFLKSLRAEFSQLVEIADAIDAAITQSRNL